MAKVSLRIYNREIEGLVDQGHTDEAIAHCRHILKTFPKHLETYRLLGKAYLEARRYGEAVDIFSRVLMSVPEDFVSHVGMSIINDEQNRLDNAIWHMERAFEAQPSNAAIQGELQRLYARRDGMEPPKIRMTRGALAHMYVQGELYPQAIAEIKAVLAQDSQRTDMQVLLAKAYFKSNQKADASELCSQLLKKSLYCYDANRIMVELVLSNAGSSESTQVYRMRVGELDPYTNFSKESVFRVSEVPDAAINLERLEYTGQEVTIGQEWSSSLGINLGESSSAGSLTSSSAEPDWLKAASVAEPQADIFNSVQSIEDNSAQPAEDIPDFLKAAGWGASTGPEQPTSIFDSPDLVSNNNNDDLVSASLPDWLKGQMPAESTPPAQSEAADVDWFNSLTETAKQNTQAVSHDMPDWLSGEGSASSQPSESAMKSADVPDWLSGLGSVEEAQQPISQTSDTPDWLAGTANEPTNSVVSSDVPDWLSGLGDEQASTPSASQNADVPDWLAGLGDSNTETQSTTPDWLSGVENNEQTSSEVSPNAPDWLSGFDEQASDISQLAQPQSTSNSNIESLGASAQEQDDAVAWLESLAAKHGAKPEELVTDPNKRSEVAPDWVQQASAANETQAAPQTPVNIESLGASAQEQDDAVAWLESLAAKHGAKPEELVTDPNKRSEVAPDWVQQASVANEAQATPQPSANLESLGASAQEQDDAVAWLESLAAKHGAKPEELVTDPNKRSEVAPDWVQQASAIGETQPEKIEISENAKNIGEQFFAEFENAASAEPSTPSGIPDWLSEKQPITPIENNDLPDWMGDAKTQQHDYASANLSQDDLSNWLNNLDDGNAIQQPEAQTAAPEMKDLPDWMSGIDAKPDVQEEDWQKPVEAAMESKPASASFEPVPVSQDSDLPDWLAGVDKSVEVNPETIDDEDDTPPWLAREAWEEKAVAPTPIKSSDWHPMEPTIKSAPKQESKPVVQAQPKQPVASQAKAQPAPKAQQPKKSSEKKESPTNTVALNQAKGELDRGDIPAALEHYEKLIKKGKHLEETIRDLTESLYRYPVEVGIWQTLGDAYMRANRLKEALEAYNKAEELIR